MDIIHKYYFYVGTCMGDNNQHMAIQNAVSGQRLHWERLFERFQACRRSRHSRDRLLHPRPNHQNDVALSFRDPKTRLAQGSCQWSLYSNRPFAQVLFHFHNEDTNMGARQAFLSKLCCSEMQQCTTTKKSIRWYSIWQYQRAV